MDKLIMIVAIVALTLVIGKGVHFGYKTWIEPEQPELTQQEKEIERLHKEVSKR